MSVAEAIGKLKKEMEKQDIHPENGLGNELFLFSSTLAPVVNVDLLVANEKRQILLSWRDDPHSGTGWHIPGGCIRLMETFEERIQKTAKAELGTEVICGKSPVYVFEIFSREAREIENRRERAHFITMVFECHLPRDCCMEMQEKEKWECGDLKWFDRLPDNFLAVQQCYRDHWEEISRKIWRK